MKKEKETKRTSIVRKSALKKGRPAEHEDFLTDLSRLRQPEAVAKGKESLGDRIRKARQARGLTLEDISSRTSIDVNTLKQVESNKMAPPLGQLVRLGKALDMRLGYLISPGVDKAMAVVRADQRHPVSRYGEKRREQYGYLYESLAPEKGNRLMEPFIVTLLPSDVEEFSTHDGQEFLFVLEGRIKVQVGKEKELLQTGDAVYYDSTQPHLVKSVSGEKARILAVLYTELR
jgi:transcriptional regulator with XRE-family HTH domain